MNPALASPSPFATKTPRRVPWVGLIVFAILLALPILPAPFALPDFRLALLGRFLCYAIVAIGIDLIWGYTGILSLGHGVWFGLGAYCAAMSLKLEATGGKMPDFMGRSGIESLPWWWQPFNSPLFGLAMAVLVPTVFAALLGWASFRSRVTGVFFSILSQALALVVVTFFIGQQGTIGGTNGMTNFKTLWGLDLNSSGVQRGLFWISAFALLATYLGARALVNGRFGRILQAIRDGENRVRFAGYDPAAYKTFVYALSAGIAGLAGALFVLQVGLVTPTEMDISHSVQMVLWVAIGGRATLVGAILGALLVNLGQNALSEQFPTVWSYFIGAAFLIFVLFLPRGLVGAWDDVRAKFNKGRSARGTAREAQPVATST
jgi:urea transport system permease protein